MSHSFVARSGSSVPWRGARSLAAAKVKACREELKSQEVGMALYGLYGLQRLGNSEEVRGLMAALVAKLELCRRELRATDIDKVIRQLRRMEDSEEIRYSLLVFLEEVLDRAVSAANLFRTSRQ